ncbi:polysaccharide pyruvyl transferase family protein [Pseudonocardia cypriaca]|uniref:Polysaccharide pyruvyl transferase WcaK-like protein n=1 Tax=Pseudonocardia cypriaca TaxID=882449 RepID=A0A543GAI5_9PSEU|nr:polysaccharide pyruvyl transferase family protein [Pseudonocardia cypriaca]TQM43106.1 polysaccharide pyruvyl transferase WcaK-like protein [Pseudonocardia cypriaca]
MDRTGIAPASNETRVLVENGEYWLNNKGDLAILDVSVRRLTRQWPSARVGVLTFAPGLLRAYEPAVEPICYQRGGDWPRRSPRRLTGRRVPELTGPLFNAWDAATALPGRVARRLQPAHRSVDRTGSGRADRERPALRREGGRLPNALADATAVIAIGGGYLTDVDRFQTERTLDLLGYATTHGIPAFLIGQGIGPLGDEALLRHAADVLPLVDLIALREGLRGPDLLRRLGVPADRVIVTGDDAVELGYTVRPRELGNDIGVCLRVADYSPVDTRMRTALAAAVQSLAAERSAALVPLIISEHAAEDRRATLPLLAGSAATAAPLGRFASARSLCRQVGRCRVVVTGAYHNAVFALSQGIPVVGMSTSQYYDDKFNGLAAMFGDGLDLVRLDGEDVEDRLRRSVERMWHEAPRLRASLLDAAAHQVLASRAVFDRIVGIVDGKVSRQPTNDPPSPPTCRL